ncbi:MAG: N-acetylmuramoyl-L-alanine amidase [Coriobacteriales bacterium]
MRVNVNGGHSRLTPGAGGYLDEVDCDRAVKDALISELRARGHEVSDSTSDASGQGRILREQAEMANSAGAELAVSIHLNSGGGTGTEVWYYGGSGEGERYASAISSRLASALGIPDRGAKASTGLYWLRKTRMTAVLVEVCFVDSEADRDAWGRTPVSSMAAAIADGIVGGGTSAVASGGTAVHQSSGGGGGNDSGALDVDGLWGPATTRALQRHFGTPCDGVVSSQGASYRGIVKAAAGGWEWTHDAHGSTVMRAIQSAVGAGADGLIGPNTINDLEEHYGVTPDGVLSRPSETVKRMQRALNDGSF